MTNAWSVQLAVLLGIVVACEQRPPPASPSPDPGAEPRADSPAEKPEAATPGVPPGAFDVPQGGCPAAGGDADPLCAAARVLPVTLTRIPTKLHGVLALPGGKVHNRSTRELYAIGSLPGASGSWEIVRIPAGASLGGDLHGGSPQTTTDVDWVSVTPPAPDGSGAFRYDISAIGVKVFDGGELTVVDRPGGGVRFELDGAGPFASNITSAGQMNGGAAIVYAPRR